MAQILKSGTIGLINEIGVVIGNNASILRDLVARGEISYLERKFIATRFTCYTIENRDFL